MWEKVLEDSVIMKELGKVEALEFSTILNSLDAVMFDCDGIFYANNLKTFNFNSVSYSLKALLLKVQFLVYFFSICVGVLWLASKMIDKANTLVKDLRTLNKRIFFLTNNSTKTRQELLKKLNMMGFEATLVIITMNY